MNHRLATMLPATGSYAGLIMLALNGALCIGAAMAFGLRHRNTASVYGISQTQVFQSKYYRHGSATVWWSGARPWIYVVSSSGSTLLVAGATTLCVQQLIVRLCVGRVHFGTSPIDMDFGIKCELGANVHGNGTTGLCQRNGSFDTSTFGEVVYSLGHFLQGMLVALLLPVTDHVVAIRANWKRKEGYEERFKAGVHVKDLFGSLGAVYPVYNLFVRVAYGIDAVPDSLSMSGMQRQIGRAGFSTSSYSSNGAEWACGFITASSLGLVVSIVLAADRYNDMDRNDRLHEMLLEPSRGTKRVSCVRGVLGLLLCMTSVLSGILYVFSWNSERVVLGATESTLSWMVVALLMLLWPVIGCVLVVVRAMAILFENKQATMRKSSYALVKTDSAWMSDLLELDASPSP